MHAAKAALRKRIVEYTHGLPSEYMVDSNIGIYENFINLPQYKEAKHIFAYYSVGREPDTLRIIEHAIEYEKTIALPVSYEDGIMEPRIIRSFDDLVMGRFGIPAPPEDAQLMAMEDIDLVIVPGVTFDKNGFRLGRGGGYYDRFLSETNAFTVGLAREKLLYDVPTESHDMGVKCLITEKRERDFF